MIFNIGDFEKSYSQSENIKVVFIGQTYAGWNIFFGKFTNIFSCSAL